MEFQQNYYLFFEYIMENKYFEKEIYKEFFFLPLFLKRKNHKTRINKAMKQTPATIITIIIGNDKPLEDNCDY